MLASDATMPIAHRSILPVVSSLRASLSNTPCIDSGRCAESTPNSVRKRPPIASTSTYSFSCD